MTSETSGPPLGTPQPEPPRPDPADRDAPASADLDAPAPPPLPPYSSTSGDELNLLLGESLTKPSPDPLLGEFATVPSDAGVGPEAPPAGSFDAVPALTEAAPVPPATAIADP